MTICENYWQYFPTHNFGYDWNQGAIFAMGSSWPDRLKMAIHGDLQILLTIYAIRVLMNFIDFNWLLLAIGYINCHQYLHIAVESHLTYCARY